MFYILNFYYFKSFEFWNSKIEFFIYLINFFFNKILQKTDIGKFEKKFFFITDTPNCKFQ